MFFLGCRLGTSYQMQSLGIGNPFFFIYQKQQWGFVGNRGARVLWGGEEAPSEKIEEKLNRVKNIKNREISEIFPPIFFT